MALGRSTGITKDRVGIVHTKMLIWKYKFAIESRTFMLTSSGEESSSRMRDVTINIRAKRNQRDLIDQAAELQGKSRSEFMLESAYLKAQDVLLDKTFFVLDDARSQQFVDLLDAPSVPNEKLHKLLTNKAPWE